MKALHLALGAALILTQALHGGIITYMATLNGTSEVPPTGSPGTGEATVIVNTTAQTLEVEIVFSGLESATTASHIHCCTTTPDSGTAGVATDTPSFPGFPLGVTSGSYMDTFDLTSAGSYNPAFVTAEGNVAGAEAALLAGLAAGDAYLNIHTVTFPGGAINGFLVATPEPASLLTVGVALAGLLLLHRKATK